jgi:TDG/mug DNA glycosylase family protein
VRPTPADLEAARGRTCPDLLGPGLRLLFVGINPSLWTAAVGAHFARPGNRFWPALYAAGLTDHLVSPVEGMSPQDAESVVAQGIGVTNIVARATARADELSRDELEAGAQRLRRLVSRRKPEVVAIAGITAYRMAFDRPRATVGRQPGDLAGAQLWVVPNPSGLNAHASLDSLAEDYRAVGVAAGILSIP